MAFQGLALVLAKLRWPDLIACERHNDLGLDAYAPPSVSADGRGKGVSSSITGTFEKLNSDAKEAKKQYSDLAVLLFYTPKKILQPKKLAWAAKIRESYACELVVISREDIILSLQLPDNVSICRTHLRIPIPYQPPLTDLVQQTREAAASEAADWAAHPRLAGKPQIDLNAALLDDKGNETREVFAASHLFTLLLQSRRIVLESPAGGGKTTSLIQLARTAGADGAIPVLVDLPLWIRSGVDILDYIAQLRAFRARGIDPSALARIPEAEPYLFLLNGWNEIAAARSQEGADALRAIERAFPTAGILVATRVHHIKPPLPGAIRIRLLPLSPEQRLRYLEVALGTEPAYNLSGTLSADRTLDEITRTPFILSEVTALYRSGRDIPSTKIALLAAVVDLMEGLDQHSTHLQSDPLLGHTEDYLRSLAMNLTERGDVVLSDVEARRICSSVIDALRSNGQISAQLDPGDILHALSSHHILEISNYPTVTFRFQHQQFQEYYSALALRRELSQLVATGNSQQRLAFGQRYLNEPSWEESLRMVASGLAANPSDLAAGAFLVRSALHADPVFAGSLARLCGIAVWNEIRAELGQQFRALYAASSESYRQCGLAGMIATGSPDFSDILIPLMSHPDQQTSFTPYRAGTEFHLSSLGTSWQKIVETWPEASRSQFVSELAILQGQTDIASEFLKSDPSLNVRLEALRALAWNGRYTEIAAVLKPLADGPFDEVISRLDVEDIPASLRPRAIARYEVMLASAADPKIRFQAILRLLALGDDTCVTQLKAELADLTPALLNDLGDYHLRPAVQLLEKHDPNWLSDWVTNRMVEGILSGDTWLSLVRGVSESLRTELLSRVSGENLDHRRARSIIGLLARTAAPDLAKNVFDRFCECTAARETDPANTHNRAIHSQLSTLLHLIPVSIIVDGLSDMLASGPRAEEVAIVTEMFSRTGADHDDLRDILSDDLRLQLRRYMKAAVSIVAGLDSFSGGAMSRLVSALGEVGDPADMADVIALIQRDLQRMREGAAAIARRDRTTIHRTDTTSYAFSYVRALVQLGSIDAKEDLLDLLQIPEYETAAAWGLRLLAKKELGNHPILEQIGWIARDYRQIKGSASEWLSAFDENRRLECANAIRQRVVDLLTETRGLGAKAAPFQLFRLKELTKVLAAVDPHRSADLILDVAELPMRPNGWASIALLQSLIFGGQVLPTTRVFGIVDAVTAPLRNRGPFSNPSDVFVPLFCVLPFLDAPALGIAKLRELLAEFRLPLYSQRQLFAAIGQCSHPDGLSLLRELALHNEEAFQNVAREWLEAVAESPQPGAKQLLLSFADPEVADGVFGLKLPEYAVDFLAARLSILARADDGLADRILFLGSQPTQPRQRLILAHVVASIGSPKALIAGLNLIYDTAERPVPYELVRAMEDLFLEKRPHGTSNSYTLVPREATEIKIRLFELLKRDPRRARSAYYLLGRIEEWRLEYGRPSSEPRHPAYESAENWPPVEEPKPS